MSNRRKPGLDVELGYVCRSLTVEVPLGRISRGTAEEIKVRRRLWMLAAVATSVSWLCAQEPAAPGDPPVSETAGPSSETPAEAVGETPENGVAFDPTDNAEWESRHAADRVPSATKPPGFRPHDHGIGWFEQSRERVRRRRSELWKRVAEVRDRSSHLRSRGRESLNEERERSGSARTSTEVAGGGTGPPTSP